MQYSNRLYSFSDYPFGMLMPGRDLRTEDYRFGLNGKENLNDVKGVGKLQDYGMRMYDLRLGRFVTVDPLSKDFPWYSCYQFSGNKPIWAIDLDGLEEKIYQTTLKDNWGFKASMNIANMTTLGKEFNKALNSQNRVDVYYFTFNSRESLGDGTIVSGVQFHDEGFAIGYGGLGITKKVSSQGELQQFMNSSYQASEINPAELQNSFNQGKSVILLGIAEQILDVPNGFIPDQQKNLRISSTEVLVHEQSAHGMNEINNKPIPGNIEHKEYFGENSYSSPDAKSLLTDKKYEKTIAGKAIREIKKIVDNFYEKKDKK